MSLKKIIPAIIVLATLAACADSTGPVANGCTIVSGSQYCTGV